MPIYEEKLISPFAVRFTQRHIRPVFQNGMGLEDTIREITTRPGSGDYDVILEAPFPNIEIVRWYLRDDDHAEPDAKHWFTLDNRRLYCLQRVATKLWPQRVAVVVEGLYAATDDIRRKDDSASAGRTVAIGHSMKMLTVHWDWRGAVNSNVQGTAAAFRVMQVDDAKGSVAELMDAPAPPSMLELYFQGGGDAQCSTTPKMDGSSDHSTADPSTPRSSMLSESDAAQAAALEYSSLALVDQGLIGKWYGAHGETYDVKRKTNTSWSCMRMDPNGPKTFFIFWYDEQSDVLWWGSSWTLYMEANSLRERAQQVSWLNAQAGQSAQVRFTWHRSRSQALELAAQKAAPPAAIQAPKVQVPKQRQQQGRPARKRTHGRPATRTVVAAA